MVDFIGRFESLDQDWLQIQQKLKIDVSLPKLNFNGNRLRDYREYYNKQLVSTVRERFAVDVEYFNYQFEG